MNPSKYVISHNLHRRHLTTSQRAMVASKLATLKHGEAGNGRKVEVSNDTSTLGDAAKQLNVGRATVARAKQVQEHGSESVKKAVEQGEIPGGSDFLREKAFDDSHADSRIVRQNRETRQKPGDSR